MNIVHRRIVSNENHVVVHNVLQLAESVVSRCVVLSKNAEGAIVAIDNDDRTMRALVNEAQGFAHSVFWSQGDGSFEDVMTRFHM